MTWVNAVDIFLPFLFYSMFCWVVFFFFCLFFRFFPTNFYFCFLVLNHHVVLPCFCLLLLFFVCFVFICFLYVFVVPSDGVFTRRHTAECAFCTVFYSVSGFSTMLPWGGRGGAGTTVSSSDVFCLCPFALVFTVFFALSHFFFVHHLRFPLVFTVFSGFMMLLMLRCTLGWGEVGWGNHVHVKLITLLRLHHVADGTGWDVNVPCNLLTLLMLCHAGVGGV